MSTDAVVVPYRRRVVDGGDVYDLAKDIDANGLKSSLEVSTEMVLVDGARRLDAFRLLHKTTIPVVVIGDRAALQRMLDELDIRFRQKHGSLIQRYRDVERRRNIYMALYPFQADRPMSPEEHQRKCVGDRGRSFFQMASFTMRHMSPEVLTFIEQTPLATNQKAIFELAHLPIGDQMAAAEGLLRSIFSTGRRVAGAAPPDPHSPKFIDTPVANVDIPPPVRPKSKGLRRPQREKGRMEDVLLAVTRGRNGLNDLCREWNEDRRSDMAFALHARANIEAILNTAIRELQKLVEQCSGDNS